MKLKFSALVALAATLVAGCAAYYSVFGLSQLFAGASVAVVIMATSLEFSKVIAVSLLEKYWNQLGKSLRLYLIVGVTILVCITSAGIYGFLSNAYQKTASNLEVSEAAINVLTNKKSLFEKGIADNQKIIDLKTTRLSQLSSLRTLQEGRIDAAKGNSSQGHARADIDASSKEVQTLNSEIDKINSKNSVLADSVNYYANKAIETKAKGNSTSEIGPLKYLAQLTGYPMDKIINWFILLLIFVFDPLAVALVIATNKVLEIERREKNTVISDPETDTDVNDDYGDEDVEAPEFEWHPMPPTKGAELIREIEAHEPEVSSSNIELSEPEPIISEPEPSLSVEEHLSKIQDEEVENIREITNNILVEEPVIEPVIEPTIEPTQSQQRGPVIPNGRIELDDIREKRGFVGSIPTNNVQRVNSKNRYGGYFKR